MTHSFTFSRLRSERIGSDVFILNMIGGTAGWLRKNRKLLFKHNLSYMKITYKTFWNVNI